MRNRKVGSKKMWVFYSGLVAVVYLAATGNGDPAAYGAIGLMTTTTVAAIGAKDYKAGTPPAG